MVPIWIASCLLNAVPRLEVSGIESCVDRAELERELQARLPADAEATSLWVRRAVDTESVVVELFAHNDEKLLSRTLPGGTADCPELPRAIAQVVERRLRTLAAETAQHDVEQGEPDLQGPAPDVTVSHARFGVAVRAEAGAALGVFPSGGDARINVEAVFGPARGPFLAGFGSLRVEPPVTIGDGAAIAGTGLGGGMFGFGFDVGPVLVVPTLGAGAGMTVAHGFGFERAQTPVLPMGAGIALLRVEHDGLTGSVGVEAPLVHIALSEVGGARVELPSARLFVTIGVRLPTIHLGD
jgi:hypothetical protein